MSVDLSTLTLFPATPSQTTEARRRTLSEWGKGLAYSRAITRPRFLNPIRLQI